MLKASLSGQVRQTHLPKWKPLLPLFEAVMNSFQAIQERNPDAPRLRIEVIRAPDLGITGPAPIDGFVVSDNGVGFTDENMDSFNTAFSEYKQLRGGKGLGRFLWLKAFDKVEVTSTFSDDESEFVRRRFTFDEAYDPDEVEITQVEAEQPGTEIRLIGFREPYKSEAVWDPESIARRMCEHFILLFMQAACPRVELVDENQTLLVNDVFEQQFSASARTEEFAIKDRRFSVYGFRLSEPRSARHRLVYCANDRAVVSEALDQHIPNLSGRLSDEDGNTFVYVAVVTGAYLNDRVNNARTAFDIADEAEAEVLQPSLLEEEIRRSEIRERCIEFVQEDLAGILADINVAKLERIRSYVQTDAPHYRILLKRASEFIDRIPIGGSKNDLEAALHRELHLREVELKREGNRIITEAAKLDDYDAYQERLSHFMESYNELGVAALAQYVMHRRIILDLFAKALSSDAKDGKYPLESVLHQIIFPMRSTSDETLLSQQNLWILDERLNFHTLIASDKRLSQIEPLKSSSSMRPDLLIFDQDFALSEGDQPLTSLTVVEFKRPMRNDYGAEDNPLKQVIKTVEEIRANQGLDAAGRPINVASAEIPTNCFVVCDLTPRMRSVLKDWDASVTPDNQGYYGYHRNHRLYYEVVDYNKVLRDAERRNKMFFDKLNVL